ncbi:hypothetical protein TNCT_451621 [Trichonephila clavata]|uniref:protein-tyrosine-phosphatase n=1 Tax=Trichonephila clavata TaxID=2740835 RepID=A0A8X6FG77_TRICU|nr:hypothetical protein TNCT_451621 [Trichonephila clavata]
MTENEGLKEGKGVLVHCFAGISRSPTIVIAYLMQKLDMTPEEAYFFVEKRKIHISPSLHFIEQLNMHQEALMDNRA